MSDQLKRSDQINMLEILLRAKRRFRPMKAEYMLVERTNCAGERNEKSVFKMTEKVRTERDARLEAFGISDTKLKVHRLGGNKTFALRRAQIIMNKQ